MGGGPPGSAGVPPACCPVAWRSVSLRSGTRPRCRRERNGLGRSRVLEPLPVELGGGDGETVPRLVRAGRPRSRVGIRHGFAVAALEDALLPEKIAGGC